MQALCAVLGALAAVMLPMALAGWLLGRPSQRRQFRHDPRGTISGQEDR